MSLLVLSYFKMEKLKAVCYGQMVPVLEVDLYLILSCATYQPCDLEQVTKRNLCDLAQRM